MFTRRTILAAPLAALAEEPATRFTFAGMTLPWSAFSFARALQGVKAAGFSQVAWGVSHSGKPLLGPTAPLDQAKRLADQCLDLGLKPVMMFSTVNLEADNALAAGRMTLVR